MAAGLHVSISAETILNFFGLEISNSIFTSLIVSFLLVGFAVYFRSQFRHTDKPSALQNFVEMIVEALYNFVHSITENHQKSALFFPIIATFFIFIVLNNYLGLFPGVGYVMVQEQHISQSDLSTQAMASTAPAETMAEVTEDAEEKHAAEAVNASATHDEAATSGEASAVHKAVPLLRAATADLNTTLALAIISVVLTQVFGVSHLGLAYFKKFFDFSSPISFFVGILELVLEIAKIVSFAFRLFGNIFAGEVLLAVMLYLVGVLVPAPFYALEIFVGFIQGLVFSMLSLLFFNLATKGHHEEEHELAQA
jgi:F-type H+-transporting ATPase subunit a